MKTEVPFYRQEAKDDCAPTALKMVLDYLGITARQIGAFLRIETREYIKKTGNEIGSDLQECPFLCGHRWETNYPIMHIIEEHGFFETNPDYHDAPEDIVDEYGIEYIINYIKYEGNLK